MLKNSRFLNRKTLLFLAAADIIIIIVIVFLIYNNTVTNRNFNKILDQVDTAISRSAYESAETLLLKITPYTKSRQNSLRTIKRAYKISSAVDNYDFFYKIVSAEYLKNKNDKDLIYIYLSVLNKTGQYEKTLKMFEKIKNTEYFSNIAVEASAGVFLSTGNIDVLKAINDLDIIDTASGIVSQELYEGMTEQFNNHQLLLNNLLLIYMKNGSFGKAQSLLDEFISEMIINKELSALIYNDNQEYMKAYNLLQNAVNYSEYRNPDFLLVYADILMHLKKYGSAEEVYRYVISEDSDYSHIPYLNLEWINYIGNNDFKNSYIDKSLEIFPEKNNIINAFLIEAAASGIDIINTKTLINEIFNDKQINYNRYISGLWELFNLELFSDQLNIYFADELYRLGMYDDLYVFLNDSKIRNKDWADYYRALFSFSFEHDIEKAVLYFNNYYNAAGKWEALYNIAVLNMYQKNYESAQVFFTKILPSVVNNRTVSDIYTFKAYCALKIKDYSYAGECLEKASEKGNISLLLKSLITYYRVKRVEAH